MAILPIASQYSSIVALFVLMNSRSCFILWVVASISFWTSSNLTLESSICFLVSLCFFLIFFNPLLAFLCSSRIAWTYKIKEKAYFFSRVDKPAMLIALEGNKIIVVIEEDSIKGICIETTLTKAIPKISTWPYLYS